MVAIGDIHGDFDRLQQVLRLCKLTDEGIANPEAVSKKAREAFAKFPNWQRSDAELREVRNQVTFAILAEEDDMAKVTATVDALFVLLRKSFRP